MTALMGTKTLDAGAMAIKNHPTPKEINGLVRQYLNAQKSIKPTKRPPAITSHCKGDCAQAKSRSTRN